MPTSAHKYTGHELAPNKGQRVSNLGSPYKGAQNGPQHKKFKWPLSCRRPLQIASSRLYSNSACAKRPQVRAACVRNFPGFATKHDFAAF